MLSALPRELRLCLYLVLAAGAGYLLWSGGQSEMLPYCPGAARCRPMTYGTDPVRYVYQLTCCSAA